MVNDSVWSKQSMEDSRKWVLEFKYDPANNRELGGWYHLRGMWECLYLSICEKHLQYVPRKTVSASFSLASHFPCSEPLLVLSSRSFCSPPAKGTDRYPCLLLGNILFPLLEIYHQRNSLHAAGVCFKWKHFREAQCHSDVKVDVFVSSSFIGCELLIPCYDLCITLEQHK